MLMSSQKCDAARPHCGACVKAWRGTTQVPPPDGYVHPSEPQCSYDPIEGLTLSESVNPAERIRQLEEQVAALKFQLQDNGIVESPGSSSGISNSTIGAQRQSSIAPPQYAIGVSATGSPGNLPEISLPRAGLEFSTGLGVGSASPGSIARSTTNSPQLRNIPGSHLDSGGNTEILLSGWSADFPPRGEMMRLITAFFAFDPCGSRMIQRADFMHSLNFTLRDPRFPHPALLHAICASASRWVMNDFVLFPNGTRRNEFADYHAGKTRQYIDRTMASGADIFQVLQACIILSWFLYAEGRWVEVWIFCSFQIRVAIPLRLNHPKTFTSYGSASPGAYLAPPKDQTDLEMRRRTWWMSVIFDRIVSVGGWIHGIEEQRIATEFPLRMSDFEAYVTVQDNPQDLRSPDLYTSHPAQYTDSFLLLIKAVMLFGKVTDMNTDYQLSHPSSPRRTDDPYERPGFPELDELVAVQFLRSLPPEYGHCLSCKPHADFGMILDTDLYLVHVVPHAATITLHNPYITFEDPASRSTARCSDSADAILNTLLQLYQLPDHTTYLTKLHPFVVICWYLACVVKVQICKRMIEIGDSEGEVRVWGEINMLRWAMCEFGSYSPIGVRQDKLLKTLMLDIVRSTNQERPLEVKLPLYPFSRSSAFEGINGSTMPTTGIAAPLPPADASDEATVVDPQAQSPSFMVNGAEANGMHGMNGVHAAQTASMQTGSYNSPPQNNGTWHNHYVTPSPPSYSSNSSSYMH